MKIMVAGPYSAPTEEQRRANAARLNGAAARVLQRGHTPLIGLNAALPVVQAAGLEGEAAYDVIMRISFALADACEGILCVGTSKGVEAEKEIFLRRGLPVYTDLSELPSQGPGTT
jgi:hypothetical protein